MAKVKYKRRNTLLSSESDSGNFARRSVKKAKFNTGIVKFSSLYSKTNFKFKILIAALTGVVIGLLTLIFVENTGLYIGGITALFQGIARLVHTAMIRAGFSDSVSNGVYNGLFWGTYLLLNVPFFLWGYYKISKQFAILSMTYLFCVQSIGLCFSFVHVDWPIIFGNTNTYNNLLADKSVNVLLFSNNVVPFYFNPVGIDWNTILPSGTITDEFGKTLTPEQFTSLTLFINGDSLYAYDNWMFRDAFMNQSYEALARCLQDAVTKYNAINPTSQIDFTFTSQLLRSWNNVNIDPVTGYGLIDDKFIQNYNFILDLYNNSNITSIFSLFLYAILFAICTSTAYTILYILGGSSAGGDYISVYFSQEKNKSIGKIVVTINTTFMALGIIFGTYLPGVLVDSSAYSGWQYIFTGNLVCSFCWVWTHGFLLDRIFPWHSMVRVEMYTSKYEEVKKYLLDSKYIHPITLFSATGGMSGKKTKVLVSVCMFIDVPKLIQLVRRIDANCLISSQKIADIDGTMTLQKQTG